MKVMDVRIGNFFVHADIAERESDIHRNYSVFGTMRTLSFLVIIAFLTLLGSCRETDSDEGLPASPDVEQYIELLKSNQFDSSNLPAFTYRDIPELLSYRNEHDIITEFPRNPVSSYLVPECTLGIYVLWTIESIRAEAVKSEYLIMRFPSLNPVLSLRESTGFNPVMSDESHRIAAKAYYDWWQENRNKDFNEFKNIDPLAATPYQWR